MNALNPGTKIDRGYGTIVVDTRVGSGAMGTVYRAWLFHNPRGPRGGEAPVPLALKQLKPKASQSPEIFAFFQNEAEALERLDHPNVVRFYDLFTYGQTTIGLPPDPVPQDPNASATMALPTAPQASNWLTLAMEYVDGDTLDIVIARNVKRARLAGPSQLPGLAFQRAWYYVQQLLGALAAAHSLGIVHRDVKPSNIMIRRDGIVKLADFGIAYLVRPAHGYKAPSPQELSPGTGTYMSPEQVLGAPLDGRSDLYSAAIVLYETLAGRPPFLPTGKSEIAIRIEQVEAPPPPIRTFVPQAPLVVDELFARALAKDPAARFSSAIEMGDAFRCALGLPDTPQWRALGEFAQVARHALTGSERNEKLATLRQVVSSLRTVPLPIHQPR